MVFKIGDRVVVGAGSQFRNQIGLSGTIVGIERPFPGLPYTVRYDSNQSHLFMKKWGDPTTRTNTYGYEDLVLIKEAPIMPVPEMELDEIERAQELLQDLQKAGS